MNAQQTTTVTAMKATTTASEAFDFEATDDFGVKVMYIYLILNIFSILLFLIFLILLIYF